MFSVVDRNAPAYIRVGAMAAVTVAVLAADPTFWGSCRVLQCLAGSCTVLQGLADTFWGLILLSFVIL